MCNYIKLFCLSITITFISPQYTCIAQDSEYYAENPSKIKIEQLKILPTDTIYPYDTIKALVIISYDIGCYDKKAFPIEAQEKVGQVLV
ncbi:hypothetical protein ACFLTE_04230 [Bacteroidota bacterium]